jgi:hypothetical protein
MVVPNLPLGPIEALDAEAISEKITVPFGLRTSPLSTSTFC